MTRETKLGIGVAGAFLVAVGAWAVLKWHQGEPSTGTDEGAQAQAEATPTENKDAPVATTPAAATTPAPQPLMNMAEGTSPTLNVVKQEPGTPPKNEAPPTGSAANTTANAEPPPPNMPSTANLSALPTTSNSAPPGNSEPMPAIPTNINIPQAGGSTPPTEQPAPAPNNPTPPAPAPIPPPSDTPTSSPAAEPKKDDPPGPVVPLSTTNAPKTPDQPAPPQAQLTPPPPSQPTVTVVPAGVLSPATLGPPGGGSTATTTGVTPVRPKAEPRVQSYLEEEYRWQPGDTFAAVSQKYYFTEKYGAALQQYNREYPLAGAGMRQNPPLMAPGQAVWVPPVRILERDYANQIADFRPLSDKGSPIVPANRTNAASGADPSGAALKLTKVRDRGETLYELARRSLGDSGQWFKIYRLNPTLSRDPKLPIPNGTVLRLPAEATVEAGDVP
jgi:hypothetical protein